MHLNSLKPILFWLLCGAATVLVAFNLAVQPEDTLIWALVALAVIIVSADLKRGIYLIIFLPLVGELVRLPWGPENGILLSDFAVTIYLGIFLFKKLTASKTQSIHGKPLGVYAPLTPPLLLFIAVAAISLFNALQFLPLKDVLAGSLYLFRFIAYVSLFFIGKEIIKTDREKNNILIAVFIAAFLIAVAGFIQLAVYPDMTRLEELGWDPHINRLVSTWLDPNFIGGYLAFIICLALARLLNLPKNDRPPYQKWPKILLVVLITTLTAALFFTYSRSAYVALAAGIITLSILRSWKILLIAAIIFAVGLGVTPRAGERLGELYQSFTSIVFNTAENPDPTARLRIKAYEQTLELVAMRPLLGSGYNTLRYVKYNEGFIDTTDLHSASGSDSSLLTILVTTGILGLIPFCILLFQILRSLWRQIKPKIKNPDSGLPLGLLAGTIALLIHSVFVNSLLFAPIMIPLWITLAIALTPLSARGGAASGGTV